MTDPTDRTYVLGTHDEELARLGLQHRVWRPRVLDVWTSAGITAGSRVVDLGCGPGYATVDLAELVGPQGTVVAIERSARFLGHTRAICEQRGLHNVEYVEADLTDAIPLTPSHDVVWCRWVACFVPDVAQVIRHALNALRPGGKVIFHEYVNYMALRTIPRLASFDAFVREVVANWHAEGGEPDSADAVLRELDAHGFDIHETTSLGYVIDPTQVMWQWPTSFIGVTLDRWADQGRAVDPAVHRLREELAALEQLPYARMVTPTVLQIVAQKPFDR